MALARVGASSVEASSITLPGSFQNGDFAILLAYRTANTTAPSLPAGWTQAAGGSSIGSDSYLCGYKLVTSASDTSGTWTNATAVTCAIYRNIATNKSLATMTANSGRNQSAASATMSYGSFGILKEPSNSWLVALGATSSTVSNIATAPTNLTNQSNLVGASGQYVVHDSNGGSTTTGGAYSASVAAGATITYVNFTFEIVAEQGLPNNYQFVKAGDGMSVSEKIR